MRTPGRLRGRGVDQVVNSVSTVKVLPMAARLRQPGQLDKPERLRIAAMVRRSDNHAASRLVTELGGASSGPRAGPGCGRLRCAHHGVRRT